MRLRSWFPICVMALVAGTGVASAQLHREPAAGSITVGADLGVVVPDEEYHTGFAPGVYAEYYITDRVSLRVLGGWARNNVVGTDDLFLEQYRGHVNVAYNWEREEWHPFVTAGIGGHSLRLREDDHGSSRWHGRLAANVGGGIEYFVRPKVTFKAEAAYLWVERGSLDVEASGVALSLGIKKYF